MFDDTLDAIHRVLHHTEDYRHLGCGLAAGSSSTSSWSKSSILVRGRAHEVVEVLVHAGKLLVVSIQLDLGHPFQHQLLLMDVGEGASPLPDTPVLSRKGSARPGIQR